MYVCVCVCECHQKQSQGAQCKYWRLEAHDSKSINLEESDLQKL